MKFQVTGMITSADDAEMLTALEWIKDNYGTEVQTSQATGSTKEIEFGIGMTTFSDSTTCISALKTQFTTRLVEYNLIMNHDQPTE